MISALNQFFLDRYKDGDIIVYEKARVLLYFQLFALFLFFPLTIVYPGIINDYSILPYFISLIVVDLSVLLLLRLGRFSIAGNGFIILAGMILWAALFKLTVSSRPVDEVLPVLSIIITLMGMVPLVVVSRILPVVLYYLVNTAILVCFFQHVSYLRGMSGVFWISYRAMTFLSVLQISMISFFIFTSYRYIIRRVYMAEDEIQAKNENLLRSNRNYENLTRELVESRNELSLREEQYRDLYENALVGMITLNEPDGMILKANETAQLILGFSLKDNPDKLYYIGDFYESIWDRERITVELQFNKKIVAWDTRFRRLDDGRNIWIEITARYYPEHNRTDAVFTDITSIKMTEHNLYRLTYYDSLTDLPNRTLFMQRVQSEIMRYQRRNNQDYIFSIMCIGIDRFKNINEMHGKATGDALLKALAQRLKERFRDNDSVARMEGDKFLILLTDIENHESITAIVQKIMEIFGEPVIVEDNNIFITGSVGVTLYPLDGDNPSDLLGRSETALYQAKGKGGDTYHLYDDELNSLLIENLHMGWELHEAVRKKQFMVYFQPKVNMNGQLFGMESLVRWQSPTRGMVPPSRFIPLAEKNGMIVEIGKIVLEQSLLLMKKWIDSGYVPPKISVNLSPQQFIQPNLADGIADIIRETGIPPSLLELEITESGIMHNEEDSIRKLGLLHSMGVSLSIDDFGTGYSSLSKLRDYPIDVVKIDRSFILNIPGDDRSETIVRTIIDLARNLGFDVVAEGVENAEQLDFLARSGCEQFQGFYFSTPVPSGEFEEILKQGSVFPAAAKNTC